MYGDDKYMFCAVRVNDLFITNNEWREMDWVIYTVLTKLMHRQGSIQQSKEKMRKLKRPNKKNETSENR